MDHIVYLDAKAKELHNLLIGKKKMILRGAMGRKTPYERVAIGDVLYFIENKGDAVFKAKGTVLNTFFTPKLSREESFLTLDDFQQDLQLNTGLKKRFAGKRYLSLITVNDVILLDEELAFDKSGYSNMDDWLVLENSNPILNREKELSKS